jgi:hypothetical protein
VIEHRKRVTPALEDGRALALLLMRRAEHPREMIEQALKKTLQLLSAPSVDFQDLSE